MSQISFQHLFFNSNLLNERKLEMKTNGEIFPQFSTFLCNISHKVHI